MTSTEVPYEVDKSVMEEMKLKTHICNRCGHKGETYTLFADNGHPFNLCPGCCSSVLQVMFDDMSLPQISDLLKKVIK